MSLNNIPLYSQIIEYLKEKINDGFFLPGQQLPTEKVLAEQFKVSRITSKRALEELDREGLIYRKKGSGSFVRNRQTDSKNIQAVDITSRINIVALVMPFGDTLGKSMDVIQGLSAALKSNGYYITVHITHQNVEEEREIINNLVKDGVSGIILYPVSHRKNTDLIYRLLLDNYPIITIDKYFDAFSANCVISDNFNGSYLATSHLIELGHKEIVFITDRDIESATSVRDRYLGFCKALKDNSLELNDNSMVSLESLNISNEILMDDLNSNNPSKRNLLDPLRRIIYDLMTKSNPCTAIHTVHDYAAISIIKVALKMGVNIPGELSIIGFDNIENGAYLEVPLTTMGQDFTKMGEEAGNLIIDKIKNNFTNESKRIILPVQLITRSSTAPRML